MLNFKTIIIFTVFFTNSLNLFAADLTIEHVANAGVKISSGEKTVLVDALFPPHKRFNSLNDENFSELTMQGADVIMATHTHSDHFGVSRVSTFLKKNTKSLFIGTPQTLKKLEGKADTYQLTSESLAAFQSKLFSHHNINVDALNFPHGDPEAHSKTQNYAFLIEVNGWKVLHIGDGGLNSERIEGLKLADRSIDVALVHDRCLRQDDCAERMKQMNVGKVVFIHMTDDRIKPVSEWIKANLHNATILVTGHESISISR